MGLFDPKPGTFLDKAQQWMTPERGAALQGVGLGLSQMAAGQPVNLSPSYNALMQRQQQAQARQKLEESGVMSRFNDEQRAILAQMEPSAAQKIIAATLFQNTQPTKGVEINGQLVNPTTGQVIGDYRTPDQPDPVRGVNVGGRLVNPITGELIADHSEPGATGYIASGEQAQALGLNPENAYNVTVENGQMRATQIGGGGTSINIDNGSEVGTIPPGFELLTDPATGARSMRPIPGGPAAQKIGESENVNKAAADKAQQALDLVRSVRDDPSLASITGIFQGNIPAGIPALSGGQDGADLNAKIQQIQGQAFLQAFNDLKGGGQITQIEGEKATNAIARLQRAQSPEAYREALNELEEVIELGLSRANGETPLSEGEDPLGLFK